MAILFVNEGTLDIRTLTTFGVSVKENENAIGYFGTGFKYALATCLRYKQEVCVQAGDSKYKFFTKSEMIRGKIFEVIYIKVNNKKEKTLGITTELGKNWNLLNAYREFYSNCIDEGGIIVERGNIPSEYPICVMVSGQLFTEAHRKRNTIILDKRKKKSIIFQ